MSYKPYLKRRQAVLDLIGDGVAVIPTSPERYRNRDTHYPYRFDSYFWYLSAFPEPEAVIVLVGGDAPKSILFCRAKNEEREVWDGFRYGPSFAATSFGFDEAYVIDEFDQRFPELIINKPSLWYSVGHDQHWDAKITRALNHVRTQCRAGMRAPAAINDIRSNLDAMRLLKDKHEISVLRQAAKISSMGHLSAMEACRPDMMEYELEAELAYTFRKNGASTHSFPPIVAGGKNACVLHYVENDHKLKSGDLVLIDAGCEFGGYAGDITRTFPVNGKFSPAQKDVYEIVLAAQKAGIEAIAPGAPFGRYHQEALRTLVQGMIDLKLLSGSVDGIIESEVYRQFYMHRAGHWLGIDVHDAGEYKDKEEWTSLKPGMALTVEPGLYIRPAENVPKHLQNIGIRIEDDVLVTSSGREVYTSVPKEIKEIEELMRR